MRTHVERFEGACALWLKDGRDLLPPKNRKWCLNKSSVFDAGDITKIQGKDFQWSQTSMTIWTLLDAIYVGGKTRFRKTPDDGSRAPTNQENFQSTIKISFPARFRDQNTLQELSFSFRRQKTHTRKIYNSNSTLQTSRDDEAAQ